jgi:hypothetical protein
MANLIGALVGAVIDRQDGDSGVKGAIIGSVSETAIRTVVPIAVTYMIGWAVIYGFRKIVAAASDGAARPLKGSY